MNTEKKLLNDKKILIKANSDLSEEIPKVKIAYHNSIQQNIATCKEKDALQQSYSQVHAGH